MGRLPRASLPAAIFLWIATCLPAMAGPDRALIGPISVLGDRPHQFDAGVGVFGFRHNIDKHSQAGRIELRIGNKIGYLGPAVGLLGSRDGIRYIYGGVYVDFAYRKFVLTPLLGIGVFRKGNYTDLGGPLEFRESMELAYRVTDRWRVGVSVAHVSNAEIYRVNPGQEDLLLTCAVGF